MDMEQQTGSKLGKEYVKAIYCHPAYLSYMQRTSCEMLDWMKHKLESILSGEIAITSDMQLIPPYGRKRRGTKEPLDESERGEWKSWLKTQHSENEDHGIQVHHFMANRWRNNGNGYKLYLLGLQNHFMNHKFSYGDCSHEIKRCLLLGRKAVANLDSILKSRNIPLPTKVHLVKVWFFQWLNMDVTVGP